MQQTIAISSFERFPIHCGTTTRHFPLKVDSTRELAKNQFLFTLGEMLLGSKPKGWAVAEQPHGDTVALLDGAPSTSMTLLEGADGLITQRPDQVLSILTADCLSIFFYLEDPPVVGLVHAGWRGAAKGIVRRAVSAFNPLSRNQIQKLHVAFGPSIHSCCYEVGKEFRDLFPKSLEEREGRLYLDLVRENRRQLLETGFSPEQIGPPGPCTGCHPDQFYSYRKEGNSAYRMLSWIALRPRV